MTGSEPIARRWFPLVEPNRQEVTGSHWPLLGTLVDICASARSRADAVKAEQVVVEEIERLEVLFSVYNPASLLRRWICDPTVATCPEFDDLLSLALVWQQRTRGAFNVGTSTFSDLWTAAAATGKQPTMHALSTRAHAIATAPYRFDGSRLQQVSDCSGVNLNAIAKGFIVDRAVQAAWRRCDLITLTVNAGGDIVHRGATPVAVGIEDPSNMTDNAPPAFVVSLDNAAIATSGSGRRGTSVGQEWISHVLDPRTGNPAISSRSVTIVAPDATTADVVATAVTAMSIDHGLAFIDELNTVAVASAPIRCWIIDHHDAIHNTGEACSTQRPRLFTGGVDVGQ